MCSGYLFAVFKQQTRNETKIIEFLGKLYYVKELFIYFMQSW